MTRLKSRRLRGGRQVRGSELERAADRFLSETKISSLGRGVMPLFAWGELNEAKLLYCHHCLNFGWVLGGCKFHFLPSKDCAWFKDDGSERFGDAGIKLLSSSKKTLRLDKESRR